MVVQIEQWEVDADPEAVFRFCLDQGWSDGLPVIPPTAARVEEMLAATERDPGLSLGLLGPRSSPVTIEKLAVNSVMAGCEPGYFPLVIAAMEGILEDRFNIGGIQTTTNPAGVLVFANGPLARAVGLHAGSGALGPGWRANATIGRAVRLILLNVGGARPGLGDLSTHGSPSKYTFCFAENEADSPWEPYHVGKGWDADASTVSVFPVAGPTNVVCLGSAGDAHAYLTNLGRAIASHGSNSLYMQDPDVVVLLGPDAAITASRAGITKSAARGIIYDAISVPREQFAPGNIDHFKLTKPYSLRDTEIRPIQSSERIHLVVVGGPGEHSAYCSSFNLSYGVTKQVRSK